MKPLLVQGLFCCKKIKAPGGLFAKQGGSHGAIREPLVIYKSFDEAYHHPPCARTQNVRHLNFEQIYYIIVLNLCQY